MRQIWLGLIGTWLLLQGCIFGDFSVVDLTPKELPLRPYNTGGDLDSPYIAAIVDIQGILVDVEESRLLSLTGIRNTVAHVHTVLERIDKWDDVRAVVLRINTPGGTVTASDLIYHEIEEYRLTHPNIPVYAMMMDLATSGGYYAAMASEKVWAHPTTVTGSIGVIVQGINLAGLFDKIGVADTTVKSGEHKDILSPLRPPTESDRKLMQAVVDSLYGKFLERVKKGRPNLTEEQIKAVADGRVLTAEQAKAAGLVDEIGYFNDMLAALAAAAGVPSLRAVVFRNYERTDENLYVASSPSSGLEGLATVPWKALLGGALPGGSPFLYMWPGAAGLAH